MRYRQLYLLPIVALLLSACSGIDYLFGCPVPEADPEPAIHEQLAAASSVTTQDPHAPDASVAEDAQDPQALAVNDYPVLTDRPQNGSCSL